MFKVAIAALSLIWLMPSTASANAKIRNFCEARAVAGDVDACVQQQGAALKRLTNWLMVSMSNSDHPAMQHLSELVETKCKKSDNIAAVNCVVAGMKASPHGELAGASPMSRSYRTKGGGGAAFSNEVRDVQKALSSAGYQPGPADGLMGKATAAAIRQYQEAKGLAATGKIDAELLASLGFTEEGGSGTVLRRSISAD